MWASAPDWLLHALVELLSECDVYCLWLFAVECDLPALRSFLRRRSPFAPLDRKRANHTAMVHGCWKALCVLSGVDRNTPVGRYRLRVRTVDRILEQLQDFVGTLRPHPQRRLAMLMAATRGSVPEFVMYAAAQRGHLESVVWLHHVAEHDPVKALETAASHGHSAVVAWILKHGLDPPKNSNSLRRVSHVLEFYGQRHVHITSWVDLDPKRNGRMVSMFSRQWGFASHGSSSSVYPIADMAARYGDLATMQEILEHPAFQDAYTTNAVDFAAAAGHLHIIQWLKETHPDAFHNSIALRLAIGNGHLEVADWMREQQLGGSTLRSLSVVVATKGDLPTLRWMVAAMPGINTVDVALHAARAGHLHIIEWLGETEQWFVDKQEHHVAMRLAKAASDRGHTSLVQWLLSQCEDEEVDISVLMSAAASGSSELVRWLVETYECWDPILFSWASRTSSTATLTYLYELSIVKARERHVPLRSVLRVKREEWIYNGHYETLDWLLRHGFCEDILNKRSFDQIIAMERAYVKQQRCLGLVDEFTRSVSQMEIARLRGMLKSVIELYEPASLRKMAWLPEWAVRQRSLRSLQRLREIRHPQLLSRTVFRIALRATNDETIVKWFLQQEPSLFSLRVVKWAIGYEFSRLLHWILDEFVPSRIGTAFDASLLQHCKRIARLPDCGQVVHTT